MPRVKAKAQPAPPNAASGQRPVAQADDAPFRAYVNVLLSDAQKEGYDEWAVSEFYWQTFDSMVADGVGLSVKREPKNGGFLASGTQRDPKSPNAGLVVTARGGSAATSLGRLLYTLSYLSTGDTWEAVVPIVATDRW